MKGYMEKILEVDLTSGKISTTSLDEQLARDFVGGSGLAAKLILDRLGAAIATLDPLSPENPLVFATGPLTGTGLPSTGRSTVSAISPYTGIWGEANVGGFFGAELKFAGFDVLYITGKAQQPVYLRIEDNQVEIVPASDLWGKGTYEVTDTLTAKYDNGRKKVQVACIGPAAENGVLFASIVHNKGHLFGRCGMGAVMASKHLKAIVVRGSQKVPVFDPDRAREVRKEWRELQEGSIILESIGGMGSLSGMDTGYLTGDVPTRNWTLGTWDEGQALINAPALSENYLIGTKTCYGCSISCKRHVEVKEGPYAIEPGPGPEYETVAVFGSLCLNSDLASICWINRFCNDYGMDTISCGSTVAWAIDCYEAGLINAEVTGGLELTWGNTEAIVELVKQIGNCQGFGAILAKGSRRAARELGAATESLLTTVKGLESPMHDPRATHGLGLAYATGYRGSCHVSDKTMWIEQGVSLYPGVNITDAVEGQVSKGKAQLVVTAQNLAGIFSNAAILCEFGSIPIDDLNLCAGLAVVTGEEWSPELIQERGERIWLTKRVINCLRGIRSQDDRLPDKILTPLEDGVTAGSVPDIELMLREFYQLRGLDATGRPLPDKLAQVGLAEANQLLATAAAG
ncbi:MAG: aldehyde ferredoxin oxidoreductase family protein [Clostridia bacterium]|nr:aldehyde ferredoxin oxidoreductase family protein [Clostridia bacterium]